MPPTGSFVQSNHNRNMPSPVTLASPLPPTDLRVESMTVCADFGKLGD